MQNCPSKSKKQLRDDSVWKIASLSLMMLCGVIFVIFGAVKGMGCCSSSGKRVESATKSQKIASFKSIQASHGSSTQIIPFSGNEPSPGHTKSQLSSFGTDIKRIESSLSGFGGSSKKVNSSKKKLLNGSKTSDFESVRRIPNSHSTSSLHTDPDLPVSQAMSQKLKQQQIVHEESFQMSGHQSSQFNPVHGGSFSGISNISKSKKKSLKSAK
jgi:hypothetical protein